MLALSNQRDWAQKYRPQKLEDTILPDSLMQRLIQIRDTGNGPSMLFHGKAGTGKTTVARLLHENTIEFNSSRERGIASAGKLFQTCQTPSIWYDYRLILLDEADNYTSEAQASLRNTIEALSFGNMFVLTANNPEKLSEPLHSRLVSIDFSFNNADISLKEKMVDRALEILESEGLTANRSVVKTIVGNCFPDMRKILKLLQYEIGLTKH